ncbi:hypothetical protein [Streptomyces sp. NPDC058240]|uniref:hypothetical protein n=1 Tax=Streptomyces sp. NPDC058240 TaxID=3346396 RepID=UPI0036E09354
MEGATTARPPAALVPASPALAHAAPPPLRPGNVSARMLLHMMTEQELGGLVVATHDELSAGLAMERGMISRAMPHLVAARLVTVVRRGRFQLHRMIAAFNDPRKQQRAVKALPRDMRLDVGDFEDEYERRFQFHLDEKARKAEARAKGNVAPINKPTRLKRVH